MTWGIETRFGTLTNTQAESHHKKTFKDLFESHRCLVPASGLYEWKSGKPAQPYFITRATRNTFYFAGLYKDNHFSIITKLASSFIRSIHDRQSIIMAESRIDWWLTEPFHVVAGAARLIRVPGSSGIIAVSPLATSAAMSHRLALA
jgi:putative SOS response-associated peptidase YedK